MASDTQSSAAITYNLEQALVQKPDRGDIKLPLFPQVASQVMALAADATAYAAKLPSLIHQDQALLRHHSLANDAQEQIPGTFSSPRI